MEKDKQFFYAYCGHRQGWCSSKEGCIKKDSTFDDCIYFTFTHPVSNELPNLMPQETKDWIKSLVEKKKNGN
jgi:hypothetical protein